MSTLPQRKWQRPPEEYPDRAHADNVADAVHRARLKADAKDRAFYEDLIAEERQSTAKPGAT
jgi:hypothetical protein